MQRAGNDEENRKRRQEDLKTNNNAPPNSSHDTTPIAKGTIPLSHGDDTTHYLNLLNTHLTRRKLRVAKVTSAREVATETGPLFHITLSVPDLDLKGDGTGETKQKAKDDAAKKLIKELEKQKLQHQDVLGQVTHKKPQHPISQLHELAQKLKFGKPDYQLIQRPTASDPDFLMEVSLGDYREDGRGSTKKIAKTSASWKLFKKLMWDKCQEVVEDPLPVDEISDMTEDITGEEAEETPQSFIYADLAEFQGSVRCRQVSEYGVFDAARGAADVCTELINVDELPDLDELDMTSSQIIEEKSDETPVQYDVNRTWHFTSILLEKAEQLGNVDIRFEKVKTVEDIKRSFLCFVSIRPTDYEGVENPHYQNIAHGITLEKATEKLAYVTLRHAEMLSCDLHQLTLKCILPSTGSIDLVGVV